MDVDDPSNGALRDLWALIVATTAPAEAGECARLMATGIPSLVACSLSGCALFEEDRSGWSLILQRRGEQLSSDLGQFASTELDELMNRVTRYGDLLMLSDESVPSSLRTLGAGCLAVVPVQNLRVQFGMLLVGREVPSTFSRNERFFLDTLAERLATVLENLRLRGSLERYSKELERQSGELERQVKDRTVQLRRSGHRQRVLLEITNALVQNLDREALFRAICASVRQVVPFDRLSIALLDSASGMLEVRLLESTSLKEDPFPIGTETPLAESALEPVFRKQKPQIRSRLGQRRPIGEERLLLAAGILSYVSVPLVAQGEAFGSLNVGSREDEAYAEADAEFLAEVGHQIGLALSNMLAYEEISTLKSQLEAETIYLQEEIKTYHNFEEIVGQSRALLRALDRVEAVAATDAAVLILGETGTGKELFARAVHARSTRQGRPLIKVNCAALPTGLVESELFGHEKGAFTGALSRRQGRFELADGGTLFLDEVGELAPEVQVKLLRVLQEGEFERVGGSDGIRVDVRVIAATNRNLAAAVDDGSFRADLYYRLDVFPIEVPPLRERPEDVPGLALHLAQKCAARLGKRISGIREGSLERLQRYPWPGNVRELENVIERAVILSRGAELAIDEESFQTGAAVARAAEPQTLADAERAHIEQILKSTGGRIDGAGGAAKILAMNPSTLRSRMRKLGIRRS